MPNHRYLAFILAVVFAVPLPAEPRLTPDPRLEALLVALPPLAGQGTPVAPTPTTTSNTPAAPQAVSTAATPSPVESPIPAESFTQLALVASGADEATLNAGLSRIAALANQVSATRDAARDLRGTTRAAAPSAGIAGGNHAVSGEETAATAETILAVMYASTLSRYSQYQTRLDAALDTGDYNCVSSAILFAALAKYAGLTVSGVETPDHAFCTVDAGGRKVDVETTNPYGYDPGKRREVDTGRADVKSWYVVPASNYRARRPVDDRRFLALILNNRVAALERRRDYETAIGLATDAWALQGKRWPDKDLADRILNYAVSLADAGRGAEGISFIRHARELRGDYPAYAEYAASVVGRETNALMARDAFAEAKAQIDSAADLLAPTVAAEMRRAVAANSVRYDVESGAWATARERLKTAASDLRPSDVAELAAFAWSREADALARRGAWLDAAATLDRALADLPGERNLTAQRTAYHRNYAVAAHNAAMASIKAGDTVSAKRIISEALVLVPESDILKNDLKKLGQ